MVKPVQKNTVEAQNFELDLTAINECIGIFKEIRKSRKSHVALARMKGVHQGKSDRQMNRAGGKC